MPTSYQQARDRALLVAAECQVQPGFLYSLQLPTVVTSSELSDTPPKVQMTKHASAQSCRVHAEVKAACTGSDVPYSSAAHRSSKFVSPGKIAFKSKRKHRLSQASLSFARRVARR